MYIYYILYIVYIIYYTYYIYYTIYYSPYKAVWLNLQTDLNINALNYYHCRTFTVEYKIFFYYFNL